MKLTWVPVDLRTGQIGPELPGLVITGPLKQNISQYDTASVSLSMVGDPAPPKNWLQLLRPLACALVALDTSVRPDPQPVWGGIVQQRQRGTGPLLPLPLATAESYLTRRFIRDTLQYPAANFGVCEVGQDLLNRYVAGPGLSGRPGLPLTIVMLDRGVGRDVEWHDGDDKSVYAAFGELGFEWTVTWQWQHNPERLLPVLTMGTRIGKPVTTPKPEVTFSFPGNLADITITDDYTDDKGANDVMAISDGIGEVRPQSDHQVAADFAGRPTVEFRYSPGPGIAQRAILNADAAAEVADMANGSTSISMTALYGKAPAFGDRWGIGDDIGYSASGPQFPDKPEGVVRAIGVEFSADTFSPTLAGQS